jgi:hypothetical protein
MFDIGKNLPNGIGTGRSNELLHHSHRSEYLF